MGFSGFVFWFLLICGFCFFFFNDTATTEIYTLSLHDALPICRRRPHTVGAPVMSTWLAVVGVGRSEEHTSELQSPDHLVCRLLLDKKNTIGREVEDRGSRRVRGRRPRI